VLLHQARQGPVRENPFAHERAAQWADHRERKKSGAAQKIDRENI
jgi:hypothetical protein